MNVIGIIERLVAIPDDGKGRGDVRLIGDVMEEQILAVDRVGEQLCVHLLHATFDVELTDETNRDRRLGNVHHADGDALRAARWHQN